MSVKDNFVNLRPSLLLDFANTKVLDPRITFSRASTATFYDGKTVAKAEENLLTYSQEFDNAAWTKGGSTITANATTAPDGTTTADLIYPTSTGTARWVYRTLALASGVYIRSVYAKAQNKSILYIDATGAGAIVTYFNLSTGAVGTVAAGYTATITDAGGGWYRCTIKNDSAAAFSFGAVIGVADADGSISVTANGTDGIYLWGAQLEQRSSVTAYTPTTTQPITNYIPVLQTAAANVARFDHNPVTGESLGLRVEEQRTNLVLRSQEFDNAYWSKSNLTVTPNYDVAPDGTLTAGLVVYNSTAGNHILFKNSLTSVGTVYTISVYAKAYGNSYINLADIYTGSATFDLVSGTIVSSGGGTGAIVPVGNGWYKCSFTFTASNASGGWAAYGYNNGGISFAGNGWAGTLLWGAQLEAGSFATSYIKTEASQVTRSADSASMTGTNFSSWYRADEGTIYAEASGIYGVSGTNYFVACVDDNTVNNEFVIRRAETQLQVVSNTNTVTYAALTSSFAASNLSAFKIAGTYKVDSFAASFNGASASEDTSGIVVSGANTFRIGAPAAASGGRRSMTGTIKKLAYYPARLTNTQLQALTQG